MGNMEKHHVGLILTEIQTERIVAFLNEQPDCTARIDFVIKRFKVTIGALRNADFVFSAEVKNGQLTPPGFPEPPQAAIVPLSADQIIKVSDVIETAGGFELMSKIASQVPGVKWPSLEV